MRHGEAELNVAIAEVRAMISGHAGESLQDRMKAAMRKVQGHWLITDEDGQMLVAVGVVLMDATPDETEKIEAEVRVLKALNAAISGIPVDFGAVLNEANIEDPVGINGIWLDVKKETRY